MDLQCLAWGLGACLVVAAARGRAGAQEALDCLPPKSRGDLLRQYLLAECQKCFDARRKEIESLKTLSLIHI